MAKPDSTPGMLRMGRRFKVQTYLSEEAAEPIANLAEVTGKSVGSIVASIVEKVAAGANPTPTEKIVTALKAAAQARKGKHSG